MKSPAKLRKQLSDLIKLGTGVIDPKSELATDTRVKWVEESLLCLQLMEDKLPSVVGKVLNASTSVRLKAGEASAAAFHPKIWDPETKRHYPIPFRSRLDFNALKNVHDALQTAAMKLGIEKHTYPDMIGTRLREARLKVSMDYREAAEKMGFSATSVWKWENGSSEPHTKNRPVIESFIAKLNKHSGS